MLPVGELKISQAVLLFVLLEFWK